MAKSTGSPTKRKTKKKKGRELSAERVLYKKIDQAIDAVLGEFEAVKRRAGARDTPDNRLVAKAVDTKVDFLHGLKAVVALGCCDQQQNCDFQVEV